MSSSKASKTRVAILDAARALFEAHGYFGVGLEAVAAQAGVSRQAIYLHFESKVDLLRALHERVNEQDVAPAFVKVWAAETAEGALDAWITATAEAVPKFIGIANTLNAARRSDPDVEATWEAPAAGRYADCLRLATRLKREKKLIPRLTTADAADILWCQTSIWAYECLVVDRAWPVDRWVRWQSRTLRALLFADAGPSQRAARGG
jgi:AcrR family transcriptional regulator